MPGNSILALESQVTWLKFSLLEVGDQEFLSQARFESTDPAAGNLWKFHVYSTCIWVDRYVDLQEHMVEITYAFTAPSWDESNRLISGVSKRTCENIFERLTICPFSMRVWSTAHHSTHHSLIWQYWDDARSHRRIDWPKKEGTGTPSIYQLYACLMTFNF